MLSSSTTTLPSLPALAKAGSEVAQNYFKYHRFAHLIALILALLMLGLKKYDLLVYTCAVIALIAEVLAWWCRYLEEHYHHLSRELTRRAILQDAFGKDSDSWELLQQFGDIQSLTQRAIQLDQAYYQDGGYFTSKHPQGTARFLDNLQESAFWSSFLYRHAAHRTLWMIGSVGVGMIMTVFAIIPFIAGGDVSIIPKLFSVLIIFWLADELTTATAWWEAADSSREVNRHLERMRELPVVSAENLLAVFSDYAVATAAAPPIPTHLYSTYRSSLNDLWEQQRAKYNPQVAQ
jgi:hypothetical protein